MALPISYFETLPRRSLASFKMHARRAGMTLEAYIARRATGDKRCPACPACSTWKAEDDFQANAHNWDGLHATCRGCNSRIARRGRQGRCFSPAALAARRASIDESHARKTRAAKLASRKAAIKRQNHDRDLDVKTYRVARRTHQTDFEKILPDARRAFEALLAAEDKSRRGGRPKRRSA